MKHWLQNMRPPWLDHTESSSSSSSAYRNTTGFTRFDIGEKTEEVDDDNTEDGNVEHCSQKTIAEFEQENHRDAGECMDDRITTKQAALNVTNAIQGMSVVSFPYAVQQGGHWAVLGIVLVSYLCSYTGCTLIDCLYEKSHTGERIRARGSYVDIAEHVWGRPWGTRVVNWVQIVELLMTCILYIVLCADLLQGIFPSAPLSFAAWAGLSALLLLPCAMMTSLRHVSVISLWNMATHLLVNLLVIGYCLCYARYWQWSKLRFSVNLATFPISLGIIVFSYTSHIFLPSLEGSLVQRRSFPTMLYITHFLAAVSKAIFGLFGFLTFGDKTEEVISNNFHIIWLKILVNSALYLKSLLSYPQFYYATVKILEEISTTSSYNQNSGRLTTWAVAWRVALIAVTYVLAICIPHYAILMGLIGSFTGTMLSFVWPAYFHLRLKSSQLPWWICVWDGAILAAGALCGLLGMFYSSFALYQAMSSTDQHLTNTTAGLRYRPSPLFPRIDSQFAPKLSTEGFSSLWDSSWTGVNSTLADEH